MKVIRNLLVISLWCILISGCSPVIHGIGVYEGSYPSGVRHSFGYHPDGSIDVYIHAKKRPIILALSSYEPVVWSIKADEGVVIKEIILSGNHHSKVKGVGTEVRITRQQFGYTYKPNAKNSKFVYRVIEYTGGIEFETFQGIYGGKEFSIH